MLMRRSPRRDLPSELDCLDKYPNILTALRVFAFRPVCRATDRPLKLAAGDFIVYTATLRHRVNPLARGQRLACVFWIPRLVRDDVKREQLFELDRTIQQLTRSAVDPEALVRLTGHHHSPLRLRTDV